jgi:hypothetical protein
LLCRYLHIEQAYWYFLFKVGVVMLPIPVPISNAEIRVGEF